MECLSLPLTVGRVYFVDRNGGRNGGMEWRNGGMVELRNGGQNGGMAEWQNGGWNGGGWNGGMAEWWNGRMVIE